jgi:hypothetical protein
MQYTVKPMANKAVLNAAAFANQDKSSWGFQTRKTQ